jgi:hypothetical protein
MDTGHKEEAPKGPDRRREFRAALALQGQTAVAFARAVGVSTNHLTQVVMGNRTSKRVSDAVSTLISSAFE